LNVTNHIGTIALALAPDIFTPKEIHAMLKY